MDKFSIARTPHSREYPPGAEAPAAGTYEQRNVLGSSTGTLVSLGRGEPLPAAPRGFTWSKVDAASDDPSPT